MLGTYVIYSIHWGIEILFLSRFHPRLKAITALKVYGIFFQTTTITFFLVFLSITTLFIFSFFTFIDIVGFAQLLIYSISYF